LVKGVILGGGGGMAIPDFETIMLPLLKFLSDGKEHAKRDVVGILAKQFNLNENELMQLQPSGRNPVFDNRVAWARAYLNKAGLVDAPRWGFWQITNKGKEVLKAAPSKINVNFLDQFPKFKEFRTPKKDKDWKSTASAERILQKTPEELLESGYQEIGQALVRDILERIKQCTPNFFERLVIELLLEMGYGGSKEDAAEAIGKTGDEGIDGIIKEDRLGLDCIYIQAKRWEGQVGRPEIQKFAGALQGKRAKKGIFITTSDFSQEAKGYVENIDNKIILINGEFLAELMIEHNIGVSPVASFDIKKLDSDYFSE